jgi:hypothetical protein
MPTVQLQLMKMHLKVCKKQEMKPSSQTNDLVEGKPFAWWHPYDDKQTEDGYYIGFKESVAHLKEIMTKEVCLYTFVLYLFLRSHKIN